MSLNDPKKIISLISELNDLLESWNINISDDNVHTLRLKLEDVSVTDNANGELSKALELTEQNASAIAISKDNSECLLEKGRALLSKVEKVLEQANARVENGVEVLNMWKINDDNSRKWLKTAEKEYDRSVKEYNKAVDDYNASLPELERAAKRLNSCLDSQRQDKDGRITPSCSYEKSEYDERLRITKELENVVKEKMEVMERAKKQLEMASDAYKIASNMCQESQVLLEKSRKLLDLSNSSYRNANDAVSSALSALEFDRQAEKDNSQQKEHNTESSLCYDKIKTALNGVYTAVNIIMDTSDSCERLNALMRSDLESKLSLLYRFSRLQPDKIIIKKI